jgi:hypothetical protein
LGVCQAQRSFNLWEIFWYTLLDIQGVFNIAQAEFFIELVGTLNMDHVTTTKIFAWNL